MKSSLRTLKACPSEVWPLWEKLISQDGVVAVGGGYHSSVGVASKEVAADNNVPVVFAETWNDTITSSMLDQIFRIAPLSSEVAKVDVEFIKTLEGIDKVVILTENTDYGIPAAESNKAGLEEAGMEVEVFSVDIGTQRLLWDYRANQGRRTRSNSEFGDR